ncbi:3-deoxy-D-manno-octulosonic acid transferase [Vibrio astriarenae]|uniref:3-deoxy-D-manno-octulosonic acid transferase n=1 Tax=Vibrio astriarenae TaxID=1481923 RepID=A0A7Z2YEU0_9VIBR|nr:lipid IV(A) 3-deoxy-D-manno-octulosonic acid transferase [Vibrio astriarenae]QIA64474.1 3-deoxy-D-manno-octulosonic acid transferase [Vibrio astriarenae]
MLARWLYTLVLFLLSPVLLWGLYRKRSNKPSFNQRWVEHFGFTPQLFGSKRPVIWIHAVSVGEVLAAKRLIADLVKKYPEKLVLVTTTTSTGAEQAQKIEGIEHRYMPIDFSWCVKNFLKVVDPQVLLIIETELWPNTINAVARAKVPIVLVNGRLSEKSLNNYQKIQPLIRPLLKQIDLVLTVGERDKHRFEKLGIATDKALSTGNLKYDVRVPEHAQRNGAELKRLLGEDRKVLVAASTHQGEDEIVLKAFMQARQSIPELLLILVPRHPERFDDVAALISSNNLKYVRRTQQENELDLDVYLADTIGEMFTFMFAADLVLMGGSFIGDKVGGHNYIEPLAASKPCLTGPSYYNFQEIAEDLIELNALTVVSEDNLSDTIVTQLLAPTVQTLTPNWAAYIDSKASSIDKTKAYITRYLQ